MEMLLAICSNDERLQTWYQCTSWVESSWQKLVKERLSYTASARAKVAIVNQLNIKGDAPGRMFER